MRHLLGIEGVSKQEIVGLLDAAEEYYVQDSGRNAAHRETLRGITILNVFFEASTRTRSSFQLAAKRLGADVVNINATTSSVVKGETLLDTARNLEVMRADVLVLRHHASGAPHFLAPRTRAHVINAGDGTHEHPTQALLDAFTIRRRLGSIEGRVVAICGDVLHSRVARSNALLLGKLGAQVRLCGPRTMLPLHAETLGETASVTWKFDEAVAGADVIMMLRIQNERLAGAMMATTREYARTFGLNAARLALAKPTAIVMHPGPINRGVEIDPLIADGPQSVILDQVEAGVAVRAAVLAHVVAAA